MQSHNKGTWGVAILNEASYYEEDLTPHITIERGGVGLIKYVTCFSANMESWETFGRVHIGGQSAECFKCAKYRERY